MNDYLKSGRQALRLLYFLIIGLAITKAVTSLFVINEQFRIPNGIDTWLFIVFISFVTRFFLGAYRVLSFDIDVELRRSKIIVDIIGFFVQALAFYVFALNYNHVVAAQWMIIIICAIDIVWLLFLAVFFQIIDNTFTQWIIHNVIMVVFLALNLIFWNNIALFVSASLIAFIVDFAFNHNFYFSIKSSSGLRIFVAGPYGDHQPKEIIESNVEKAREVGKQLALMGHFPFIPHTMLHGWETDDRFTIQHFKSIDFNWLEFCDALYFIAPSPGANIELAIASKKGLQIFRDMHEVPDASKQVKPKV
jgi:hypothetical protein